MKKLSILTGLVLLLNVVAFGQDIPDLKNYGLRTLSKINEAEDTLYAKDKSVSLYYGRVLDYRIENNKVELWECFHIANKVYESRMLEHFNIFYLPTTKDEDIIDCKARYIARDGSVKELSKEDLVEIEEDETKYKVFRFPAAEIGSTMEYYYIVRRERIRESGAYTLASRHTKELEFSVIFPSHLNFEITTYNGLPVAESMVDDESKIKCIYVQAEDIAKVNEDPMSFHDAHLPRIEYLLTHNYANSRMRLNTLSNFANDFYQTVTELDKKETKVLKKISSQIKVDNKLSMQEKIGVIENYVKSNYYYYSINSSAFAYLENINNMKIFNLMGSLRLFYHLFKMHDIDMEIVLTSDKTDRWFDKNHNGSGYFELILIYFPKIDQYMSPNYMGLRTGYPAAAATGQEGVFFKEKIIGNAGSFMHDTKYIPPINMKLNGDTIDVHISIKPLETEISGTIRRVLTGYNGGNLQYRLSDIDLNKTSDDEDEADEDTEYISHIEDHYLALGRESIIVNNFQMQNTKKGDVIRKPLILTADLKDYFLTKTSNDSVFVSIGAFIGEQSEFKQDVPRTLPIERRSNTHYYRSIKVDIPEGYTCVNLSDLNITVYDEDNQAAAKAKFTVTTQQQGQELIIICEEHYDRLIYPVEEYEKCQRVAQAAADFNGKVLIFKKQ